MKGWIFGIADEEESFRGLLRSWVLWQTGFQQTGDEQMDTVNDRIGASHQTDIVVYRQTECIENFDGLIGLIQRQMIFIGYQTSLEEVRQVVHNAMKPTSLAVFFVAYDDARKAIGFAYGNVCCGLECGGDYFWLNELYVSEDHRKTGLGTALLDYARDWAVGQECVYMALVTHPRNTKAQALYAENGFELENLVWVDTYL
jgi:GNAT superfamily N-acetyltransferase